MIKNQTTKKSFTKLNSINIQLLCPWTSYRAYSLINPNRDYNKIRAITGHHTQFPQKHGSTGPNGGGRRPNRWGRIKRWIWLNSSAVGVVLGCSLATFVVKSLIQSGNLSTKYVLDTIFIFLFAHPGILVVVVFLIALSAILNHIAHINWRPSYGTALCQLWVAVKKMVGVRVDDIIYVYTRLKSENRQLARHNTVLLAVIYFLEVWDYICHRLSKLYDEITLTATRLLQNLFNDIADKLFTDTNYLDQNYNNMLAAQDTLAAFLHDDCGAPINNFIAYIIACVIKKLDHRFPATENALIRGFFWCNMLRDDTAVLTVIAPILVILLLLII